MKPPIALQTYSSQNGDGPVPFCVILKLINFRDRLRTKNGSDTADYASGKFLQTHRGVLGISLKANLQIQIALVDAGDEWLRRINDPLDLLLRGLFRCSFRSWTFSGWHLVLSFKQRRLKTLDFDGLGTC